jgi:hypothetical protein
MVRIDAPCLERGERIRAEMRDGKVVGAEPDRNDIVGCCPGRPPFIVLFLVAGVFQPAPHVLPVITTEGQPVACVRSRKGL